MNADLILVALGVAVCAGIAAAVWLTVLIVRAWRQIDDATTRILTRADEADARSNVHVLSNYEAHARKQARP